MTAPNEDDIEVRVIDSRETAFMIVAGKDGRVQMTSYLDPPDLAAALRTLADKVEERSHE